MVCAFTGHRPQHLPWGVREEDPRCEALKTMMLAAVEQAAALGAETFLCGMARGCDTYFAEAVLEAKTRNPALRLIAMLPCPNQAHHWPLQERQRHEAICAQCDQVRVLEPVYSDGCMLRRNAAMVEQAQLLISVFDGSPGGTAKTVAYAEEKGLRILPIWL